MASKQYTFFKAFRDATNGCTAKELRFKKLPVFDKKKHRKIAKLPLHLKKLYVPIIRMNRELRFGKMLTHEQKMHEDLLAILQDIFLYEVERAYAKKVKRGAISVCQGGILVNAKGKSSTLNG